MYTGTEALLNRVISCMYNGKYRHGKVVKATPNVLTIEYTEVGKDKPQYRSLTIAEIHGMKVEGHGL
jgi:hypothetical protein